MASSPEPGRGISPAPPDASQRSPRLAWLDLRWVGLILLVAGVVLAYAILFLRWGYYSGPPYPPGALSDEDRASMTVHWWDSTNTCCGPLPAIWPALSVLSALPLLVAAIRHRTTAIGWGVYSILSAICGFATVALATYAFVARSWLSDSGWIYSPDLGTMAIALVGYGLMLLGVLMLMRATRHSRTAATDHQQQRSRHLL